MVHRRRLSRCRLARTFGINSRPWPLARILEQEFYWPRSNCRVDDYENSYMKATYAMLWRLRAKCPLRALLFEVLSALYSVGFCLYIPSVPVFSRVMKKTRSRQKHLEKLSGPATGRDGAAVAIAAGSRSRQFGLSAVEVGGPSPMRLLTKRVKAFGGTLLKNKRNRTARPIDTKRPMHLVLRSTQAIGRQSFLSPRHTKRVSQTIKHFADRNGIRLYQVGNSGNHLHLLIRVTNRHTWKRFIRGLTSALAYTVGAYRKGSKLQTKFWDFRPFTRVVEWGRDYRLQRDYVLLNALEALGVVPYRSGSRDRPSTWLSIVDDQRRRDLEWRDR